MEAEVNCQFDGNDKIHKLYHHGQMLMELNLKMIMDKMGFPMETVVGEPNAVGNMIGVQCRRIRVGK